VDNLTREQLNDLIDAVKHYQYHHLSITNSRYEEFSNILNVLTKAIDNENFHRQCTYE
jgi:hypothetical protein